MSLDTTPFIRSIGDVAATLLSSVLGLKIVDFQSERIGTGLVGECHRIHLQYATGADGPASVVIKIAASDPNSWQTGRSLKLYEREPRFYSDIAPVLKSSALIKIYHTSFNERTAPGPPKRHTHWVGAGYPPTTKICMRSR
jgi:hypothetical protein